MKVLVTGGTGYLGAAIVRAFDAGGHEPVVFARHASGARLPGRAIDGDIRDTRAVYTSSFLALPPADSPHALTANHYQRTKVAARDVARRAAKDGLPVVTLYPGVVYGPGPATE